MGNFIMAVAVLSIVMVVLQFSSYFDKRRRERTAGSPGEPEIGAGVETFETDAGNADAVAPSE